MIYYVYIFLIYLHMYVSETEVMNLRESKGEVTWGWLSHFSSAQTRREFCLYIVHLTNKLGFM